MKSSHSLISLLKKFPQFGRLREFDEIARLTASLPMQMRKYIAFGFQKGTILYFALNHPMLTQEYNTYHANNILKMIQSCGNEFFPHLSQCKSVKFYYPKPLGRNTSGKYFTPNKHFASYFEIETTSYLQTFKEHSHANFTNQATLPQIHMIFENIRKAILEHV